MIRALGTDANGRRFLMLGLEAGNIERLMDGCAIKIDCRPFGIDATLVIDYARTKADMIEKMREAGAVLPPEKDWKR